MPKQKFAVEKGCDKRLEVSWKGMWKDVTVNLDGNTIGQFMDKNELKTGKDFSSPAGTINVQLAKVGFTPVLQVKLNGEHLEGSQASPEGMLNTAVGILYFLGGFNVLLGVIAEIMRTDFLLSLTGGIFGALFGAVYLVCAYFAKKRSAVALGIGLALLTIDTLLIFYYAAEAGGDAPTGGIVIRVFFIIGIWGGFKGIKELKKKEGTQAMQ